MEIDLDAQIAIHAANAQRTQQQILQLQNGLRELTAIFERQQGIVQFLQDMKLGKESPREGDKPTNSQGE
jgi:hypothetical protein